jgi:hypothetical protein
LNVIHGLVSVFDSLTAVCVAFVVFVKFVLVSGRLWLFCSFVSLVKMLLRFWDRYS